MTASQIQGINKDKRVNPNIPKTKVRKKKGIIQRKKQINEL